MLKNLSTGSLNVIIFVGTSFAKVFASIECTGFGGMGSICFGNCNSLFGGILGSSKFIAMVGIYGKG